MSPEISEHNLPGIGRSYQLVTRDGSEVLAVLHNSGRRDLYVSANDSTPRVSVALNDDEARQLGAVLSGAYFKPAVVARVEALIGGLLIDRVTVPASAPAVDRSIAELEIRRHTRMTVAAIVHVHGSSVVGVSIDPAAIAPVAVPVLVAVAMTLVLNVVAGLIAASMYGLGRDAAASIGLTVLARGEFALILASYAAAAGLDSRITPFVAGYVLILALGAPILAKRSTWFAAHVRLRRQPVRS